MPGSEARYRLRLFFDAGAGICLWSQDEATKARFGYPVESSALGLAHDLVQALEGMITDYDAAFDWTDPGGEQASLIAFGYEHGAPLRERVRAVMPRLRAALGPDFVVTSDYEDDPLDA